MPKTKKEHKRNEARHNPLTHPKTLLEMAIGQQMKAIKALTVKHPTLSYIEASLLRAATCKLNGDMANASIIATADEETAVRIETRCRLLLNM